MAEKQQNPAPKPEKADKIAEKKPNFFVRVGKRTARWAREMRSELKKVVWPTRTQVINNSWVVLVCIVVVGLLMALFDFFMNSGVSLLTGLTG